jgi:indolepyruvate ferredoxin oxidoreductase
MALAKVTLDDKYALESGRVYLTGTQALVRLPMMQRQRDVAAGKNTACFISGYRGSPLGGLDQTLWQARRFIEKNHIVFNPGVNEDLGATSIWGTQQVGLFPNPKYDGVYAMWYGKGPGVDRTGDVFKHANNAGTSPWGGVLALAGDDHMAKSSTLAHQSEFAFVDAMMPVLNPAGVQEFLDVGLYGFALSRFASLWVGFKVIGETVDTSASVSVDPQRVSIILPTDVEMPAGGLAVRWPDDILQQELRLHRYKLPAAMAFARANKLDKVVLGGRNARIGIVTTGKSYLDVRQALDELGIDEREAEALGLAIYKVTMTWPLEPEGIRAFADGLEEILVIEEKRSLMEWQIKDQLYNIAADRRPRIVGKVDETGKPLLPTNGELLPNQIARLIAARLGRGVPVERLNQRLETIARKEAAQQRNGTGFNRVPYFCSGCPHNSSTKVPEGSFGMAGIGCHFMAVWMDRSTLTFTQMGGEGAPWIGMQPFTNVKHVFQNLGDGTYFHSGYLALRAALAAKVNITYKILFNDAVAMTGGQRHDGNLTPSKISQQVYAEGVRRIALVSDDPTKYPVGTEWAPHVTFHHRAELDSVQKELREYEGVSVLIYDQTCAAEKRRRRKRNQFPDPPKRVFINEMVCEGCGDCSVKSNCLSVVPTETEFGRKRAIDQSSCNKDYSCLNGFCPSFVTIEGGGPRKGKAMKQEVNDTAWPTLPEPRIPSAAQPYNILITGVGGTGVVTIGALLGMAAHLENKGCSVLDMAGLAQKGGAVISHVRIAQRPEDIHAVRLAAGGANLLLGCDLVVAASTDALAKFDQGVTRAVVNTHETITGDFTRNPDLKFPGQILKLAIEAAAGASNCDFIDAQAIATALMGDSIATNLFMLGFAYQKGLIPVSGAAIDQAIELNGAAVEMNRKAFQWGRRAAHDARSVEAAAAPPKAIERLHTISNTLDEIVARRVAHLTGYQNAAYAQRYKALVERVKAVESAKAPGMNGLAEAVARFYAKLLAYKDEYEVARLYTDGTFLQAVHSQFEGDYKIKFHLAPPLLSDRDPTTGELQKQQFGPWMMRAFGVLAKLKGLRGTAFDIFGRTAERKMERRLIVEYEQTIEELLAKLSHDNHALAVQIASIPDDIRGYGHVKDAKLAAAKKKEAGLLEAFRNPQPRRTAAE